MKITKEDIETLQRYDIYDYGMRKYDDGDYIKWDDLIELLK